MARIIEQEECNEIVGGNVRRYRLLRGLKQEEVCDGLFSVSQLSKIERGKARVRPEQIPTLADRLGVTVLQLTSGDIVLDELRDTLLLAEQAAAAERTEKAVEMAREVIEKSRVLGYEELYMEAFVFECRQLNFLYEYRQVIEKIEGMLGSPHRLSPQQHASLLADQGRAYSYAGEMGRAFECYREAEEVFAAAAEEDPLTLRLLCRLSDAKYRMRNYRLAMRHAERMEEVADRLSKHYWRLMAQCMQANCWLPLGREDLAESLNLACLKEAEDNAYLGLIGAINNNLGELYIRQGRYASAHLHLQRAIRELELVKMDELLLDPMIQLAELLVLEEDEEGASRQIARTQELILRTNGAVCLYEVRALELLARLAGMRGDREEQILRLQECLDVCDRHHIVLEAYDIAARLAAVLDESGDPRATTAYRRAIRYSNACQEI